METESQILKVLRQVGIKRGQTLLDFGCGYGTYAIPAAKIVGVRGIVYALDKDKEILDKLMQKAVSQNLRNIEKMVMMDGIEIELTNDFVDVVLLFDVFHLFYFPYKDDRRRLLNEIYRIMKPSAFLSISLWSNLMKDKSENEIKNAKFRLVKETMETLTKDNKDLEKRRILNFVKV